MTTIFYIEDSPVEQLLVKKILESQYKVITANNGLEAVQKGQNQPEPALVLTDLNMPGLNGYEVATKLKATWPNTPIIALTGDNTQQARRQALIAGCSGCLIKPLSPSALLAAVKKYLNGHHETLPNTPELAQEKLAYQQKLVNRLETQVTALTQSNNQLLAVQRINRIITESLDLNHITHSTLDNLFTLLELRYLAIFLYNAKEDTLTLQEHKNFSTDYLTHISQAYHNTPTDSTLKKVIDTRRMKFITNPAQLQENLSQSPSDSLLPITSLVTLPLIVEKKLVGLLLVASEKGATFIKEQLCILELISRELAAAIDKAKIHADLQNAYQKLQELDDLKNQFIMIAGHELRTPLTLMSGYSFLLRNTPTELTEDIVEIIASQTQKLTTIVDRILDVNRLQNKEFLAEFTEIDLNEIVRQIFGTMKYMAHEKKVEMRLAQLPSPLIVRTDTLKLEAILTNLLSNAVQFTPAGGSVTVNVTTTNSTFAINIQDTGIGIPADEHERIFEKFYQVQKPLKRTHGGVGLGLAIAKDMAALCGGVITVKSEPHKGSTFVYQQPITGKHSQP